MLSAVHINGDKLFSSDQLAFKTDKSCISKLNVPVNNCLLMMDLCSIWKYPIQKNISSYNSYLHLEHGCNDVFCFSFKNE